MSKRLLVSGSSACFRRPEIVNDVITYDVITPMAARSIFEAIHWTPSIRWRIHRIEVLHEIRTCLRIENEECPESRVHVLSLADVSYVLHGHFDLTPIASSSETAAQHAGQFRRRAKGGRYFRQPCLGQTRHFADVRLLDDEEQPESFYAGRGAIDLGWMIHDRSFVDQRVHFFRPIMIDGIIDVADDTQSAGRETAS